MYTLIILGSLCLIQFLFVWWKWSEINDLKEIATDVVVVTGLTRNQKFSKAKRIGTRVVLFVGRFKKLLIIPIIILFLINLVFSTILGTFVRFIVEMFN